MVINERKIRKFLFWSLFFLFIIFLTFIFFSPKFYTNDKLENLDYNNLDNEEIYRITLDNIKLGDIILDKPVSYGNRYLYQKQFDNLLNNRFLFFFYYNLFEFLVNSMGEGNYWHAFIYTGDKVMNSLTKGGVNEENLTREFIDNYYFIILRVNTNNEIKTNAVEKANNHFKNKDIKYSFKNGLLIVFSRSTEINLNYNIKDNELVCSSYISSLYPSLNFNNKNYKYVTPIDLYDNILTKIILTKNERGFYYDK